MRLPWSRAPAPRVGQFRESYVIRWIVLPFLTTRRGFSLRYDERLHETTGRDDFAICHAFHGVERLPAGGRRPFQSGDWRGADRWRGRAAVGGLGGDRRQGA